MMNRQLQFSGMGTVAPSFTPVDTPNYSVTAGLLEHLKAGNKAQVAQARYLLASVTIGFDGTELTRSKIGLPHPILSGMTPAERIAVYSGIDIKRQDISALSALTELPTDDCISELVKAAFSNTPWPLQVIAGQGSNGYNTRRGGLVRRMQQVLMGFPDADEKFRAAALSTIRPLHEDIQYINRLDLGSLVEGVTGRFAGKYQHEARALAQH